MLSYKYYSLQSVIVTSVRTIEQSNVNFKSNTFYIMRGPDSFSRDALFLMARNHDLPSFVIIQNRNILKSQRRELIYNF